MSESWSTQPEGMMQFAEQVPIEYVLPFMEYDRRGQDKHYNYEWDELSDHIQQHGINSPIWIDYDPDSGNAHLSEGHHRLEIARDLGMATVPVAIYRRHGMGDERAVKNIGPAADFGPSAYEMDQAEYDRHQQKGWDPHFPQYAKPSALGFPVVANIKQSDYNGWTNWETWNTKLMMDNDQESYNMSRNVVRGSTNFTKLRDWAIEYIIGPTNQQALQDAQEWNDIPEAERLDWNYEDLKERNPQAADFVNQLGFGADVSDDVPNLIDPEMVNWDEIFASIEEDIAEEDGVQYEDDDMDSPGATTFPSDWVASYEGDIDESLSPLDYGGDEQYSRLSISGEPYESKHPYFDGVKGVQGFIDYKVGEERVYVGFINVNTSFEGQGLARALLEELYRRYPEKEVVWGKTMDDRVDHLKEDFRGRFPDRTASDLSDWENYDWGEAHSKPSEYYEQRQPWWVNPQTEEVNIGPKGTYHPQPNPGGYIYGEYWPQTGEIHATNYQGQQAVRAEELVRQQLNPPSMQEDESPSDRAMREYRERTADADGWSEPAMTNLNEGVKIPGDSPNKSVDSTKLLPNEKPCTYCGSPIPIESGRCGWCGMEQRPSWENVRSAAAWEGAPALYGDPDPSNNWLYLKGKVAIGDNFWALSQKLCDELEMTDEEARFISNQVARNHLPPDWDLAYGEIERGNPRIWASTIDRNHVWDVVKEKLDEHARV